MINNKKVSDDIFIFRLYSSIYIKFLNEYLLTGEDFDSFGVPRVISPKVFLPIKILHNNILFEGFTKSQLNSFICCLKNSLFNNKNVIDGQIIYLGIK